MRWFTSDTHFFHKNILKLSNRPFDTLDRMHEVLIYNWNKRITNKDTVFVLGDFSFGGQGPSTDIVSKLNGNKILIWGNHDKTPKKMLEMGFNDVYENHYIYIGNRKVYLSHFPYYPSAFQRFRTFLRGYKADERYRFRRTVDEGQWLLHGHVHTAWKQNGKQINVGVDQWDYKPVSEDEIRKLILAV